MWHIKLMILLMVMSLVRQGVAQEISAHDETDIKSYALYEKNNWKELLQYGKTAIKAGQDFTLLRLRMAYAAFMTGNFSEAILQYNQVLKNDAYNATARYYTWLCRRYLNQKELSGVHVKYLSDDVIRSAKLKKVALSEAGFETSYKTTDNSLRDNSFYTRLDLGLHLGRDITMLQSGALYNQTIDEPKFTAVTDNNAIKIQQKEYYNRTTININRRWQVKLAYHYLHTPFNNYSYNNHVGLLGVKYYSGYFDAQADAIISKLTDSTHRQYDIQLGLYPLGNMNLYIFSTGSLRQKSGSAFNLKEVVGFKILKNTWFELNWTFGRFSNLMENDAMYVYNAIDNNTFKGGATIYFSFTPNLVARAGFTYEKREFYNTSTLFNQHSITGGLSWKM